MQPRPMGAFIVPQALAEIEQIAKIAERLPRHFRAAIRRACRNLACDVRGLGRLLEEQEKRP